MQKKKFIGLIRTTLYCHFLIGLFFGFVFFSLGCKNLTSNEKMPIEKNSLETNKIPKDEKENQEISNNQNKNTLFERIKSKLKLTQPSKSSEFNIPYRSLDSSKDISVIGFASCIDQNQPQKLWNLINQSSPDLFILMGDNIYAEQVNDQPFNSEFVIDQYIKLNSDINYKNLRLKIPFLATWDDNDFGQKDGGSTYKHKEESRKIFLNYWGYLKSTLPLFQKPIYHSRIIGSKNKKIQIIMLDTRWDRSDLVKNTTQGNELKPYLSSTNKNDRILSENQWQWFEDQLKEPAQLRLIVSSIQLIAQDHGFEKWANFPHERQRFFKLIQKLKIKNAVILSGDRHLASLSKEKIKEDFNLFELTSSALNKPHPLSEPESDASYVVPSYMKINFGLIEIDWSNKQATFKIIDENNQIQIQHKHKLGL